MWLERISGGGVDLIDFATAKAHLRILHDDNDAEIMAAISAASDYLDVDDSGFGGLGFPLVSQQWSSKARGFLPSVLRLPFGRVTAVTEFRYFRIDGVSAVLGPSSYQLVRQGRDAVVVISPGSALPRVADRPDAVDIRFTAGFANVAEVPGDIIAAALQLVGFFFNNRGADSTGGVSDEITRCVHHLTRRYRRFAI